MIADRVVLSCVSTHTHTASIRLPSHRGASYFKNRTDCAVASETFLFLKKTVLEWKLRAVAIGFLSRCYSAIYVTLLLGGGKCARLVLQFFVLFRIVNCIVFSEKVCIRE